jgi:hypothetical protein
MTFRDGRMVGIFFALWLCAAGTGLAFADTYVVKHVLSTQDENFAGGDDYGDYIINITNSLNGMVHPVCAGVANPGSCFETVYVNDPTHPVISVTPPTLPVDPSPRAGDVGSCAIPAAFEVIHEFCGGGHLFFSALYDAPPNGKDLLGLFDGTDPTLDYLGYGSIDGGFMTANGNVFFIDGALDTLDVAIDLDTIPAPEPGSLMLMGTGALGLMAVVRRRTLGGL